jgi:glycosyltransferase involved in cell wall biosynthesis
MLTRALARLDSTNQYFVYCNRGHRQLALPEQQNFRVFASPIDASVRPLRYAWEQLVMPLQLRTRGLDLVHSMGYVSPIRSRLPQVVTIPDANWKELDTIPSAKRRALGYFVERSAAGAATIITGTHAAATNLAMHLSLQADRFAVIPLGADHLPVAARGQGPRHEVPYLLALSGSPLHKNIPRLIQAYERIAGDVPHELLIAGILPEALRPVVSGSRVGSRIRATGFVDDEALAALYANADLFVFPSWHEGFGLPLLEAQRFATPVAAAGIPALVEIANGSAELFDPWSVESMAAGMLRVLASPARLAALVDAGRRNVARFTWETTARETLAVYEKLAAQRRSPSSSR